MIIRKIMQFFCVLLAAGMMAACGGGGGSLESGTGSGNGSGSNNGGSTTTKAKVAVVLAVQYKNGSTVSKDHPADVTATVTKDGVAYPDVLVKFELTQVGIGSFKTQTTAKTNAEGIAKIPLHAGSSGVAAGSFKVTLQGLLANEEVTYPADKAFDTLGDETSTSTGSYAVSLKLVSKADPTQTITTVSQAVVGQVEISVTKNNQAAVGELVTLTPAIVGRLGVTTVQTLAGGKALVDLYAGDKEGAGELVASVGTGTEAASAKLVFTSKGDETVSTKPIGSLILQVRAKAGTPTTILGTSGQEELELRAIVTDTNGIAMQDQAVTFGGPLGDVIIVAQRDSKTDEQGVASATIKASTLLNKTIEVTAKVQDKTAKQSLEISGTTLTIENSNVSVSKDTNAKFTLNILLRDSQGNPIKNQPVTYSSKLNNLAAATVSTDATGLVPVIYMPVNVGDDEIQASAFNGQLVATVSKVTVRNDDFKLSLLNYTSIAGGLVQIPTNTDGSVDRPDALFELSWPSGTAGSKIQFETSVQGFVESNAKVNVKTVQLDANKKAQVALRSSTAVSLAIVRATALDSNTSAEYRASFASIVPSDLNLTASSTSIPSKSSAVLTTTVKDVTGNPVANAKVTFALLSDAGAGSLSSVTAITNQNGVAQTSYFAGGSTAQRKVQIQAEISGVILNGKLLDITGLAPVQIGLTVTDKPVSLQLTVNLKEIESQGESYVKIFNVSVTDSGGKGIANMPISFTASPLPMYSQDASGKPFTELAYAKGEFRVVDVLDGEGKVIDQVWSQGSIDNGVWQRGAHWCQNEDYNDNQTLEFNQLHCGGNLLNVSEDDANQACQLPNSVVNSLIGNGNGRLDPGMVGSISAENGGLTDSNGQLSLVYRYPKAMANWASVIVSASVETPSGDQDVDQARFDLGILATDIEDTKISPPNRVSPWGRVADCRSAQ